jgi:hypothetical protein
VCRSFSSGRRLCRRGVLPFKTYLECAMHDTERTLVSFWPYAFTWPSAYGLGFGSSSWALIGELTSAGPETGRKPKIGTSFSWSQDRRVSVAASHDLARTANTAKQASVAPAVGIQAFTLSPRQSHDPDTTGFNPVFQSRTYHRGGRQKGTR